MKLIACPVCDCEQHRYISQYSQTQHSVRCVCCGAVNVVDEQALLEADPNFEAWLDARNDEITRQQNERIQK